MTRESDEECLALIATIRARKGETAGIALPSETERLLGNLEARIAENARLRELLPGAWGRLPDGSIGKGIYDVRPPEDCPCGTESCREAWRELREAKADAQLPNPQAWRGLREEVAASRTDWQAREPHTHHVAVGDRVEFVAGSGVEGAIRFRDIIREEVRKEVQSHGAAEACRQHVRQEVAAEVARQLGEWQEAKASPTIRTWVDNLEHEVKKLRAALEAAGR